MLLGAVLFVFTAVSLLLFLAKPAWFPVAVSAGAYAFDSQFSRTLWIIGVLFVAAQLLLAWAVLRGGRKRRGGAPFGRLAEPVFAGVTGILFLGMALGGAGDWAKVARPAAGKETIEVYAHQFAWSFRYAGADGKFGKTAMRFISDAGGNPIGVDPGDPAGKDDRTTATLRIPAGRDVLLLLHSRDVIHDFFVRELRTKQDVVPGMEIPFDIHVDLPGEYEIACAELCGLGHSQMRSLLIVMEPEAYERWKRQR